MAFTVSDLIIETLKQAGVRRVYGIPGDSVNGFTDALRRDGTMTWQHVRHEEAAAFAAAGEAAPLPWPRPPQRSRPSLSGIRAACQRGLGPESAQVASRRKKRMRPSSKPATAVRPSADRAQLATQCGQGKSASRS